MALTVDQALRKAGRHARRGESARARELYEGVIARFPGNRRAAEGLGALAAAPSGPPADADAAAHYNRGNALARQGRFADAAESYRQALRLNPDDPDALSNLGAALYALGSTADAAAEFERALRLRPGDADGWVNFGNALMRLGRHTAAAESYQKAVALRPGHADAHNNLGSALHALGRHEDAVASCRAAIALAPGTDAYWRTLAAPLAAASFPAWDPAAAETVSALLAREGAVRPERIARAAVRLLERHPALATRLDGADAEIAPGALAAVCADLAGIPLLLDLMALCPIPDLALERLLAALRRRLLRDRDVAPDAPGARAVLAALALQGFANEYIYGETPAEADAVGALEAEIAAACARGETPDAGAIARLAGYRPLHRYEWADGLAAPDGLEAVFARQRDEVRAEETIRAAIPHLAPVADGTSAAVRAQYEENPYPRWIRTALPATPAPLAAVAAQLGLRLLSGAPPLPDRPEILVAGCGTGQQALATARRFAGCTVLAVDLSRASLGYAARRTAELGVGNVDYLQADILDLGRLGRTFDVVESVGVLHHMQDPIAGWRVLVDCLRAGGLMRIGLYSELARRDVVRARAAIAAAGLSAARDDMLGFRQAIVASDDPALARLAGSADFYSTSALRDLLFHVQEHRFTLPRIAEALEALGLAFCGFDLADGAVMRRFAETHSAPGAAHDLAAWHAFETANPDAFAGMYQFWVQKAV